MAERDVLPGGPAGRPPGASPSQRAAVVAGVAAALVLLVALGWFFLGRDDGSSSARPPGDAESSTPGGASASPSAGKSTADRSASPGKTASGGKSDSPAASPPSLRPSLAPDATFRNTCRYVLGDSTSDPKTGFRFLAQSVVKNTGNTGIEVEVQATWEQGEAESVVQRKRVRVDWQKGTTVKFSVPATKQQIDLMRSHTGPDANCKVIATIVATYGDLH